MSSKKFGNRDLLLASIGALVESAQALREYGDSCPAGYEKDFIAIRESLASFADQLYLLPELDEFREMLKPLPSFRLGVSIK